MSVGTRLRGLQRELDARTRHAPWRPRRVALKATARPRFWADPIAVDDPNTLFSRRRVRKLRGHVQRLAHHDDALLARLSDPRIQGVRAWEYGTLLGTLATIPERASSDAPDVGSGNSTFPQYLLDAGHAATMTTLDLPDQHEHRSDRTVHGDESLGIGRTFGTMVDPSFPAASFDLVTCISAIEHLDGDRAAHAADPVAHPRVSYERYLADSRSTIEGLTRVTRPGGRLYLTTDAYLADRQTTDAWSSPEGDTPICSAYRFEDIERTFVATVVEAGFDLVGTPRFDRALLDDENRSSWRGRWFTAFAVVARRPAASP